MLRYVATCERGIVNIRDRLTGEQRRYIVHNQELEQALLKKVADINYNVKLSLHGDLKTYTKEEYRYQREYINVRENQKRRIHKAIDY